MHRMLVMSAIVAGLLLSPLAQVAPSADVIDNLPAGIFDCLPEPIRDLTEVSSRGNRWADGAGTTSNVISWRVTTFTAVGVESGLTYTVTKRSVAAAFFDVGSADVVYGSVEGDWPADYFSGAEMWHFRHPGERSPNGGWVLEHPYHRGTDDLSAYFCYRRFS